MRESLSQHFGSGSKAITFVLLLFNISKLKSPMFAPISIQFFIFNFSNFLIKIFSPKNKLLLLFEIK